MKKESIEQYIYRKLTGQSAKTYMANLNNFLAVNPNAKNYQYKDIINYFEQLAKRYRNVNTRNLKLSAIKKYYDYLVESRQRNDHPCRLFRIKGHGIAGKSQVQFQDLFTPAELEKLLNRDGYEKLKLRNKIIISLLIYQALTPEEITRLDKENIDLDKLTVYIKASNKLSSRTLELKHVQKEYLEEYINTARPKVNTHRLLIGYRGDPETVDSIIRMLIPLKALYPERKLTATTVRQSVIANWLNKGKHPVEQVQLWSGFKWPSSILRYRRADIVEQREKINQWHPLQ